MSASVFDPYKELQSTLQTYDFAAIIPEQHIRLFARALGYLLKIGTYCYTTRLLTALRSVLSCMLGLLDSAVRNLNRILLLNTSLNSLSSAFFCIV